MIGTKLAHYEITSHLGTGGMGEVYQATDSKLGRSVAIKLLPEASPWVDFRPFPLEMVLEMVEAQQHRRFLKTHLPIDALVFSPKARYLYVARDGRDVAWSIGRFLKRGFRAA